MIHDRSSLLAALQQYTSSYPEEVAFRTQFLSLLHEARCYHRDFLPGHITGSSWIIDQSRTHVLMTLHAKLNRWLQPGGHADGDENVLRVALREAEEETGLTSLTLLTPDLFDIDIHAIPARKDFPTHDHYDVRFAFIADRNKPLLISDESHELRWIPLRDLEQFTDNASLFRMREKTKQLEFVE